MIGDISWEQSLALFQTVTSLKEELPGLINQTICVSLDMLEVFSGLALGLNAEVDRELCMVKLTAMNSSMSAHSEMSQFLEDMIETAEKGDNYQLNW